MSNQYSEGWFPECTICGCGNLGANISCLRCARKHLVESMPEGEDTLDDTFEEKGHHWKRCYFCKVTIIADPELFGHESALCVRCYNAGKLIYEKFQ